MYLNICSCLMVFFINSNLHLIYLLFDILPILRIVEPLLLELLKLQRLKWTHSELGWEGKRRPGRYNDSISPEVRYRTCFQFIANIVFSIDHAVLEILFFLNRWTFTREFDSERAGSCHGSQTVAWALPTIHWLDSGMSPCLIHWEWLCC